MNEQPISRQERQKRQVGLYVYIAGLVLWLLLAVLAIWGDMEASLFDVMWRPESKLSGVRCPVMIAADEETAVIQATLKNKTDRDENLRVRAHITEGWASLIREEVTELTLAPGQQETVQWPIKAADAAWERVILARVGTVRNNPYRQLVGVACGVLVVPVKGVTGSQVITLTLIAGVVLMIVGGYLWGIGRRRLAFEERKSRSLMILFAVLVATAVLVSFFQLWLVGLMLFILILLLVVNFLSSSG